MSCHPIPALRRALAAQTPGGVCTLSYRDLEGVLVLLESAGSAHRCHAAAAGHRSRSALRAGVETCVESWPHDPARWCGGCLVRGAMEGAP